MIRTPTAVNTASNAAGKLASGSRIKNLRPSACSSSFIRRSRARMRCDHIRSRTDRTNLRADSSRFYFLVVR